MGTAQDWTRGMAGSQSVCAVWMRASTLAEESQQAGLADPATGAPRLASVTRANHHDDAWAASQVAHRFYGTTLSKRDRPAADRAQWPRLSVGVLPSHGCHHENWIADVALSRET